MDAGKCLFFYHGIPLRFEEICSRGGREIEAAFLLVNHRGDEENRQRLSDVPGSTTCNGDQNDSNTVIRLEPLNSFLAP
jgi:hypothetical protein